VGVHQAEVRRSQMLTRAREYQIDVVYASELQPAERQGSVRHLDRAPRRAEDALPFMEVLCGFQSLCSGHGRPALMMLGTGFGDRSRVRRGTSVSRPGNKKRDLLASCEASDGTRTVGPLSMKKGRGSSMKV